MMVNILPPIFIIVIIAENQFHAVPGTFCLSDSFINRRKEFLLNKFSGFMITRFGASNYGNKWAFLALDPSPSNRRCFLNIF